MAQHPWNNKHEFQANPMTPTLEQAILPPSPQGYHPFQWLQPHNTRSNIPSTNDSRFSRSLFVNDDLPPLLGVHNVHHHTNMEYSAPQGYHDFGNQWPSKPYENPLDLSTYGNGYGLPLQTAVSGMMPAQVFPHMEQTEQHVRMDHGPISSPSGLHHATLHQSPHSNNVCTMPVSVIPADPAAVTKKNKKNGRKGQGKQCKKKSNNLESDGLTGSSKISYQQQQDLYKESTHDIEPHQTNSCDYVKGVSTGSKEGWYSTGFGYPGCSTVDTTDLVWAFQGSQDGAQHPANTLAQDGHRYAAMTGKDVQITDLSHSIINSESQVSNACDALRYEGHNVFISPEKAAFYSQFEQFVQSKNNFVSSTSTKPATLNITGGKKSTKGVVMITEHFSGQGTEIGSGLLGSGNTSMNSPVGYLQSKSSRSGSVSSEQTEDSRVQMFSKVQEDVNERLLFVRQCSVLSSSRSTSGYKPSVSTDPINRSTDPINRSRDPIALNAAKCIDMAASNYNTYNQVNERLLFLKTPPDCTNAVEKHSSAELEKSAKSPELPTEEQYKLQKDTVATNVLYNTNGDPMDEKDKCNTSDNHTNADIAIQKVSITNRTPVPLGGRVIKIDCSKEQRKSKRSPKDVKIRLTKPTVATVSESTGAVPTSEPVSLKMKKLKQLRSSAGEEGLTPTGRPSRRAKQKAEEQRLLLEQKRAQRRKRKRGGKHSDSESDDSLLFDSDTDSKAAKGSKIDHSDDDDPMWDPRKEAETTAEKEKVEPPVKAFITRQGRGRPPMYPSPVRQPSSQVLTPAVTTVAPPQPSNTPAPVKSTRPNNNLPAAFVPGPTSTRVVNTEYDSDDNSPHEYMPGDFIVEKKDFWGSEITEGKFSCWKIDKDYKLQLFSPVISERKLYHKSIAVYKPWNANQKGSCVGIETQLLSSIRGQDVITVLEKYRPKVVDECLEDDPLMEDFNVYLQTLLSENLEPGFMATIQKGNYDHYIKPLEQVDGHIAELLYSVASYAQWTQEFKNALQTFQFLRIVKNKTQSFGEVDKGEKLCQASLVDGGKPEVAISEGHLYGPYYDRDSMVDTTQEVTATTPKVFLMGKLACQYARQYHRLYHFRKRIYTKCHYMVECVKDETQDLDDIAEVVDKCLQNRKWVRLLFSEYKHLCTMIKHGSENTDTANVIAVAPLGLSSESSQLSNVAAEPTS